MEESFLSSIFLSSVFVAGGGVWAPTSPALANTNATPTIAASALFTVDPPGVCYAVEPRRGWTPRRASLLSHSRYLRPLQTHAIGARAAVDPHSRTMVKMTSLSTLWRLRAA